MSEITSRLSTALADRYKIERELGAGGMATVYLAEDIRHERQVALKVLKPDLAHALGPERFLREIKITARLTHPHILPLLDSGEADTFLYYVMPFVEGESLRDRLDREKQLPIDDAGQIAREVADALSYAHSHDVLHRDIKPENILLESGHAVVADFGIARAISAAGGDRLTDTGLAIGTPTYMSPEQAAGSGELDGRSDLYSLGCVLYEMLAGQPPFTGPTVESIVHQHLAVDAPAITNIRPAVPEAVVAALARALAKTPADRFTTVRQFSEAIASDRPETASRPAMARWGRRAVYAAVAVLAVFGAYAAVVATRAGSGDAGGAALDSLRVVVLPFENRTGDPVADVWGELVADATTRLLTQNANYLDVPVQTVVRGADPATLTDPTAVAVRLAARYVLRGRYATIGGDIRFDAELLDVATGQQAVTIDPVTGDVGSDQSVLDIVAERAAVATVAYARPNQGVGTLRGFHPPNSFETLDLWDVGHDAFCRAQFSNTIRAFERIFQRDPAFTYPRIHALATYANGGRGRLSRDSLQALAREAVPRMTQLERLYYAYLTVGQRDRSERLRVTLEADRIAGDVWIIAPYNVASSALALNRIEIAAGVVERFPFDDPCNRQWSPLWALGTRVNHLAGDHDRELEHARDAVRRFPDLAAAFGWLASAAAAAGSPAVADSAIEALVVIPADARAVVNTLVHVGNELEVHGHANAANRVYLRAYEMALERTPEGSVARARAALRALPVADALPVLQAAADSFPNSTYALGHLAAGLVKLGRTVDAEQLVERIWQINATSRWPAAIAAAAGDGRGAADALRRALDAGGRYFPEFLHSMPEFAAIRDDPSWRAIMTPRE